MLQIVPDFPPMSAASDVDPSVVCGERRLTVAFRMADESSFDRVAVVQFGGVRDWHHGYPNDEALSTHPAYDHGLKHHEFQAGREGPFGERCWIATFHEVTSTVFARALDVLGEIDPPHPRMP